MLQTLDSDKQAAVKKLMHERHKAQMAFRKAATQEVKDKHRDIMNARAREVNQICIDAGVLQMAVKTSADQVSKSLQAAKKHYDKMGEHLMAAACHNSQVCDMVSPVQLTAEDELEAKRFWNDAPQLPCTHSLVIFVYIFLMLCCCLLMLGC